MEQATQVVAEYLALTLPALGFDRDKRALNYEYPIESFYRLLAHIALTVMRPMGRMFWRG
jgi:hypothetical protein